MASFFKTTALIATIFSISVISSCKREDETCLAIVKVIRPTGAAISGANVTLLSNWALSSGEGEVAGYLQDGSSVNNAITDANGEARFEFQHPAILDIEVTHIIYGEANDLIKLEPGETVSKTVIMEQ